jgi:alkylation response protein AidB-like acyl-CoA dehydrogenase
MTRSNSAFELQATTEAGRRFVALAEAHAVDFANRAPAHDRDGSFPFENFRDMQQSGFMAGPVPRDYGGLGVESLADIMVGMSRIGRGDGSTAIAANMHIAGAAVMNRQLRRSIASGDQATAAVVQHLLRELGANRLVMCFPWTEPGTDLVSPFTEATPTDDGYIINGRKSFGTISPVAHLFFPNVRVPKPEGGYVTATAMVARDAPGFEVKENWDAMGMRASGSHDIVFTNVKISKDRLFGIRDNYSKLGRGFADFAVNANLPLISTFFGIAEAARDIAVTTLTSQRKGPSKKLMAERIPIQELVAEIEIDLAVSRAMIERMGRHADVFLQRYATTDAPPEESTALMKEVQCMKYIVNRNAITAVDRAMMVSGGAAYMTKHPLSRLYRDSRAGPFMQPFAPYEALEYIGKVALGLDPAIDR